MQDMHKSGIRKAEKEPIDARESAGSVDVCICRTMVIVDELQVTRGSFGAGGVA